MFALYLDNMCAHEVQEKNRFWMMVTIFRNPLFLSEITCEEHTTKTNPIDRLNEKKIKEKALEEFKSQKQKDYPHHVIAVRPFKTKEECQYATKQEKRKFSIK